MFETPPIWMWIIGFLLVLGPLVTVHELGHYLVGRWLGVKADVFSIGFGKELFGRTDKHGTRWRVSALPLGGYVQFRGDMNPASIPDAEELAQTSKEEQEGNFHFAALWKRALIVFAGPATNLVLAIVVFAGFLMINGKEVTTPEVSAFAPASVAKEAGLEVGDRITALDGESVESAGSLLRVVSIYPGRTFQVTFEREGKEMTLPVKAASKEVTDEFGNKGTFGDFGIGFAVPSIARFADGSPAQQAGLEVGDRITAIDGDPVRNSMEIPERVAARPGETLRIDVLRGDTPFNFEVTLGSATIKGEDGKAKQIGQLGVYIGSLEREAVSPLEAIPLAMRQTGQIVSMMITGIQQIVLGQRSVKELGGPIKIAKYSGEHLSLGPQAFVWFIALISINLAFINLLPIPALDGGHLAFYAAEAIRRKPVGPQAMEWAYRTGIVLVLALMLFVTVNDIISLPLLGG